MPRMRYATTNLALTGNEAPVYPNPANLELYTFTQQNPQYIVTTRQIPTTRVRWKTINAKVAERNSIWDFWSATLTKGQSNCTLIDHRKRFLFDVSWNEWKEKFKRVGDVADITYDLESPVDWTPPTFGFYPSTENNLADHGEDSDSDLTVSDGTLTQNGSDDDVLRKTGYALVLSDAAGAQTGASSTSLSWSQGKGNSSITLFAQFSVPDMNSSRELDIVKLSDGNNVLRIYTEYNQGSSSSQSSTSESPSSTSQSSTSTSQSSTSTSQSSTSNSVTSASSSTVSSSSSSTESSSSASSSTSQSSTSTSQSSTSASVSSTSQSSTSSEYSGAQFRLVFEWQKSGESAESLTVDELECDDSDGALWYDVALTFDNVNNNFFGYYTLSVKNDKTWDFSDNFLYGKTTITDGILSQTLPSNYPEDVTWTQLYLLNTDGGDVFVDDNEKGYVQNVMVMDDWISPLQFNTLRRLCHLWNTKTSGANPA